MDNEKPIYLSGLNGIRAIAAVGVMISHINLALASLGADGVSLFGFSEQGKAHGWLLGEQGVTMFFVLSGFLITYLLVLEKRKAGDINKKNFYVRRILRIWPLYYLYFAASLVLFFAFSSHFPNLDVVLLYTFLLANIPFIVERAIPMCAHLWSIAVEEQFYLFWPHFFRKTVNIEKILIAIIVVMVVARMALWYFFPFRFFTVLMTVNRFDCMMFGGLIALAFHKKNAFMSYIDSKMAQFLAWIVIFLHIVNIEIINSILSMEFVTIATGIIICGQINIKNRLINLENKILNFLGKYSYGIYVYHPLIIFVLSKSSLFDGIENAYLKCASIFVTVISATILISYFSYEFFEKKFIRLKGSFSTIHSSNSAIR